MKLILTISLLFLLNVSFAGRGWYFANAGNDVTGTGTIGNPYATLTKARALILAVGDSLLFKRGDNFRGYYTATNSGVAGSKIYIGAYGTGSKPIINGAKALSNTSDWVNFSGNIWKSATVIGSQTSPPYYYGKKDISNVIFNSDGSCGVKKLLYSTLAAQGDFNLSAADTLYMYSVGNPASFYSNIEVGGVYSEDLFTINTKNYIIVQNLAIKYSGNNGIMIRTCDNITVDGCDFIYSGGWYFDTTGGRQGNGVQIWQQNSNVEIKNNYVFQTFDAAISPQGNAVGYTQTNILIHNNLIVDAYYCYELFIRTPNIFSNVKFENNTCVGAGRQWSQNQRTNNIDAEHVRQATATTSSITGCTILNNIFYDGVVRYSQLSATTSQMTIDYNLINGLPVIGKFPFNSADITTIAAWRTASGSDIHSITGAPLLNSDYTLTASSPARAAGFNVGYGSDLGAFPYIPPPTFPVVNAGPDQTLTLPTSTTVLNGSAISSSGIIVSHLWTKLSGSGTITDATIYAPILVALATTTIWELAATDNFGNTSRDTVIIILNPIPIPPTAIAGSNQTITLPTANVSLSGNYTPGTNALAAAPYSWTQTYGPSATITSPNTQSTSVTGLTGTSNFTLRVTDNTGLYTTSTLVITVNPIPYVPPAGTILIKRHKTKL